MGRAVMATALLALVPVAAVLTGGLWPEDVESPRKAEEIGAYLEAHLEDGDTVQPLDWTGGAVHGMLLARAPLATRYLYDFHFYHHVSEREIRAQRLRFLTELAAARPRFVVRVTDRPWPTGEDTSAVFSELEAYLDLHYATAARGEGYSILERREQ